jgi:cystathionine beta-lyase/cystathionine gamma-synthase
VKDSTLVNHPPKVALPAGNEPVVAPVYQTVKFEFEGVDETLEHLRGERPGFFYLRTSNPTTRQLELTLAALQGRDDCVVCGSGVGAIAGALLALLQQGDHVLHFVESYGPTRRLVRQLLGRFGVKNTLLSIDDLAGVERTLRQTPTRLIIFESPTNPINKIADLAELTRMARTHGALTLLDNTFAGPHQHGQYDLDIYIHSLTKMAAGHGDVMGGAVIARAELIEKLRPEFTLYGGVLDPHAAFLVQRGLKTMPLRCRAQSESAGRIAAMLEGHPAVERVYYPGLATHPRHALAAVQMRDFGCVISFDLRGGHVAGRRFADALQFFALTPSLAATESLVMPPQLMGARDLSVEQRLAAGIGPGTVRLSVGLEDADDLLADLSQALQMAGG